MNQKTKHIEDAKAVRGLSDNISSLFRKINSFDTKAVASVEMNELVGVVQEFAVLIMMYQDLHIWLGEMSNMRQDNLSETKLKLGEFLESKSKKLLGAWQEAWKNGKFFTFEESLRGIPAHPYLSVIIFG